MCGLGLEFTFWCAIRRKNLQTTMTCPLVLQYNFGRVIEGKDRNGSFDEGAGDDG